MVYATQRNGPYWNINLSLDSAGNPTSRFIPHNHQRYADCITIQVFQSGIIYGLVQDCIRNTYTYIPRQHELQRHVPPEPQNVLNLRKTDLVQINLALPTVTVSRNTFDTHDEQTNLSFSKVPGIDNNPVQIVLASSTVALF